MKINKSLIILLMAAGSLSSCTGEWLDTVKEGVPSEVPSGRLMPIILRLLPPFMIVSHTRRHGVETFSMSRVLAMILSLVVLVARAI